MNPKIREYVEIIGIFGVIVSLAFVGLQLRQSHEIALAEQYQSRAHGVMNLLTSTLEANIDVNLIQASTEDLTEAEIFQRISIVNWAITSFDNNHYQYELGFLSDDSFQGITNAFRNIILDDFNRQLFEQQKLNYRPSFVSFVEVLAEK